MSNLAPFVAAVLRDRVVADLHDENQRLAAELEAAEAIRVEVTGPGRQPVYTVTGLFTGVDVGEFWAVPFRNDDDARMVPLAGIRELEVFVGGVRFCDMRNDFVEERSDLCVLQDPDWIDRTSTRFYLKLALRRCLINVSIVNGISDEGLDALQAGPIAACWAILANNPHVSLRIDNVWFDR